MMVTYLGRVVGHGQVRPVDLVPTTKKKLMRFLGLVEFYRAFCKNFATAVAPLTDLLKANVRLISASCHLKTSEHCYVLLLFWLHRVLMNHSSWRLMLAMWGLVQSWALQHFEVHVGSGVGPVVVYTDTQPPHPSLFVKMPESSSDEVDIVPSGLLSGHATYQG